MGNHGGISNLKSFKYKLWFIADELEIQKFNFLTLCLLNSIDDK